MYYLDDIMIPRISLLNKLGGISSPKVTNNEWLYLLSEETRNSILIEGYFVDKKSLQDVFSNNKYNKTIGNVDKAVNYHQTANTFYNIAYNDYLDKSETFLSSAIVKSINSTLRQGEGDTGFRMDSIVITGSKHTPPDYPDISRLITGFMLPLIKYSRDMYVSGEISIAEFIERAAKLHCLFEAIHPFTDGNGRSGRIYLNCMLVSVGLPPVIIKGSDSDREKYYSALDEFDSLLGRYLSFQESFYRIEGLIKESGGAEKMTDIISSALQYSLDTYICNQLENKGYKMISMQELSNKTDYTADSLRVLVNRGQLIAKKAGKGWCSNANLFIKNGSVEMEKLLD